MFSGMVKPFGKEVLDTVETSFRSESKTKTKCRSFYQRESERILTAECEIGDAF
jgi:hypothetical protein